MGHPDFFAQHLAAPERSATGDELARCHADVMSIEMRGRRIAAQRNDDGFAPW